MRNRNEFGRGYTELSAEDLELVTGGAPTYQMPVDYSGQALLSSELSADDPRQGLLTSGHVDNPGNAPSLWDRIRSLKLLSTSVRIKESVQSELSVTRKN